MNTDSLRSQFAIPKDDNDKPIPPFAFTEQGILMLSLFVAIRLSIAVIRAYEAASRALIQEGDINEHLNSIKRHLNFPDPQIAPIFTCS